MPVSLLSVRIKRLPHAADMKLPEYHSAGAAGVDLAAALALKAELVLAPGERQGVPTGFSIELPKGYEAQIRPRSGLAIKHGITVLNSPGTIDSDYRGEIKVLLVNLSQKPFTLKRGMRIAQMVIAPVTQVVFEESHTLEITERGQNGFGSSGLH